VTGGARGEELAFVLFVLRKTPRSRIPSELVVPPTFLVVMPLCTRPIIIAANAVSFSSAGHLIGINEL
jgi:hypothetical protein